MWCNYQLLTSAYNAIQIRFLLLMFLVRFHPCVHPPSLLPDRPEPTVIYQTRTVTVNS